MRVSFDRTGDAAVVHVQETRLTYPMLLSFQSQVRGFVDGGPRFLAVDLGTVAYVDSASIGCLVDVHRLLTRRGGTLTLVGVLPRVETMLRMAGVHKIAPIRPAVDSVGAMRDHAPLSSRFEGEPWQSD
jgi:anti-sigma B factor antagonist